jgi:hypothetical protein
MGLGACEVPGEEMPKYDVDYPAAVREGNKHLRCRAICFELLVGPARTTALPSTAIDVTQNVMGQFVLSKEQQSRICNWLIGTLGDEDYRFRAVAFSDADDIIYSAMFCYGHSLSAYSKFSIGNRFDLWGTNAYGGSL